MTEKGPFAAETLDCAADEHPEWCGAPDKPDRNARDARPRARRGARRTGAARRRRHEPLALGRRTRRAAATQGLQPCAAARPRQRPLHALERRILTSIAAAVSTRRPTGLRAHAGGGYRAIYNLADPDTSRFMIATGESGHIFSPHYRDLAPLWNAASRLRWPATRRAQARRRAGADVHAAITPIRHGASHARDLAAWVRLARVVIRP